MKRSDLKPDPERVRDWLQRSRARQRDRASREAARSSFKRKARIPKGVRARALARSEGLCIVCVHDLRRVGKRPGAALRARTLHHVLPQAKFPEFALVESNLAGVCDRHHAQHENAFRRIPRLALPDCAIELAEEHGLGWYVERIYPDFEEQPGVIPEGVITSQDQARFEAKINRSAGLGPDGDCYEWLPPRNRYGHGQFSVGRAGTSAHRAAWFFATGAWPQDEVLRRCRNAACVRFEHLILGTFAERFEMKVDRSLGYGPTGECHKWTGAVNRHGYGQIRPPGHGLVLASHAAWFLATGEWPELCVLHHCDTPLCVRFEHLFSGTQADNIADMNRKGRNGLIRLSWTQVEGIRSAGGQQRDIAATFGVSQATVWRIKHGKQRRPV